MLLCCSGVVFRTDKDEESIDRLVVQYDAATTAGCCNDRDQVYGGHYRRQCTLVTRSTLSLHSFSQFDLPLIPILLISGHRLAACPSPS